MFQELLPDKNDHFPTIRFRYTRSRSSCYSDACLSSHINNKSLVCYLTAEFTSLSPSVSYLLKIPAQVDSCLYQKHRSWADN